MPSGQRDLGQDTLTGNDIALHMREIDRTQAEQRMLVT